MSLSQRQAPSLDNLRYYEKLIDHFWSISMWNNITSFFDSKFHVSDKKVCGAADLCKFESHQSIPGLANLLHINVTGWGIEPGGHVSGKEFLLIPRVHHGRGALILHCFSKERVWHRCKSEIEKKIDQISYVQKHKKVGSKKYTQPWQFVEMYVTIQIPGIQGTIFRNNNRK